MYFRMVIDQRCHKLLPPILMLIPNSRCEVPKNNWSNTPWPWFRGRPAPYISPPKPFGYRYHSVGNLLLRFCHNLSHPTALLAFLVAMTTKHPDGGADAACPAGRRILPPRPRVEERCGEEFDSVAPPRRGLAKSSKDHI